MRQNFIVLTDKGVRRGGRQTRGGSGGGPSVLTGTNKRPLEGRDKEGLAKRQPDSNGRGGRGGGAGRGGAGRDETPKGNK